MGTRNRMAEPTLGGPGEVSHVRRVLKLWVVLSIICIALASWSTR